MSLRLGSVSVDLDPLRCYFQIHGLGEPPAHLSDVVLRRALPRFLELFARHRIAATLFVVGSDVQERGESLSAGGQLLGEAARAGHELGNHSFGHPYDLARLPRSAIEREIRDCHRVLTTLTGRPPVGFRAPGYELSPMLLEVLESYGYRYDSSLFPCPPYYLAKLAVLAKMALGRRASASIIGRPEAQLGPTQPYRPDLERPWRRGNAALCELPVAVTPWLRLPAIGTFLLAAAPLRAALLHGMSRQLFFNLELHGLDLLDADDDGLPEVLRQRQLDLRLPLGQRLRAFDELLTKLQEQTQVLPLQAALQELEQRGALG